MIRDAINVQDLRVLAATEPLLFLPWAVKRSMTAKLRQSIQSLLVNLGNDEVGRHALSAAIMTGMSKAEDKDYDPHRRMVTAVFGPEGSATVRAKP